MGYSIFNTKFLFVKTLFLEKKVLYPRILSCLLWHKRYGTVPVSNQIFSFIRNKSVGLWVTCRTLVSTVRTVLQVYWRLEILLLAWLEARWLHTRNSNLMGQLQTKKIHRPTVFDHRSTTSAACLCSNGKWSKFTHKVKWKITELLQCYIQFLTV